MRTRGVFGRRDEDRCSGLLCARQAARQAHGRCEEYLWRGVTDFSRLARVRAVGRRPGDARIRRQWPRPAAQRRPADFVPLAPAAVETTRPPINRAALSSWRNVFFLLAHRTLDVADIFHSIQKKSLRNPESIVFCDKHHRSREFLTMLTVETLSVELLSVKFRTNGMKQSVDHVGSLP